MNELILKGQKAKEASNILGNLSTDEKNKGLLAMADYLVKYEDFIIEANKIDLQEAVNRGTAKTMLDRLALDKDKGWLMD